MKFTREVRNLINAAGGYRTGIVRAVSTADGLDVEIGGGLVTGLLFLNAYAAPGVGDVVAVVGRPGAYLVLDKIGTAGATLGPNLLPNPGFELGSSNDWPSSWSSGASTVTRVNDETLAHSSGAAVEFNLTGQPAAYGPSLGMPDAIQVDAGVTYRLAAWWRGQVSDANVTCRIHIATAALDTDAFAFDPEGTYDLVASNVTTSGWTEVSGTRTIPATHNYARVYLSVLTATGRATDFVYVDDVSLRQQI